MKLESGTLVAERWEIGEVIGRGGLGVVYAAKHAFTGKCGALKVVETRGQHAEVFADKMAAEASLLARAKHPNLVEVFDAGRFDEGGAVWMVMERLEGRDLAKVLSEEKSLPVERATRYAEGIAGAVAVAHEAGVIHRDLKPDNIIITNKDVVKVIDFGAARFKNSGATIEGAIVGTVPYMSPEHLRPKDGQELDGRTDVWALGLIYLEMLQGHHPFCPASRDMRDKGKVLHAIFNTEIPPAMEFGVEVAALIERATHKDRDQRFASMADFAAAIHRVGGASQKIPTERLSESDLGLSVVPSVVATAPMSASTPPLGAAANTAAPSQSLPPPALPATGGSRVVHLPKSVIVVVSVLVAILSALVVVVVMRSGEPETSSDVPLFLPMPSAVPPPSAAIASAVETSVSPAGGLVPPKPSSSVALTPSVTAASPQPRPPFPKWKPKPQPPPHHDPKAIPSSNKPKSKPDIPRVDW